MGEYAVVVSTVASVLILALAGVGKTLPASAAKASATVTRAAQAAHVPVFGARRALARAPYKRHQLRTLYALGWIAGSRDRATCLLATATGRSTEPQARDALHRVGDWRGLLRRSALTEKAAVSSIDRGFRSSCPL